MQSYCGKIDAHPTEASLLAIVAIGLGAAPTSVHALPLSSDTCAGSRPV